LTPLPEKPEGVFVCPQASGVNSFAWFEAAIKSPATCRVLITQRKNQPEQKAD
jgi:hypothetical protein